LVIGVDATALATSAKKAGYNVFAVDYFGDQDLKKVCKNNLSIITQQAGKSCGQLETDFSPDELLTLAKRLLKNHRIDVALLASGLEDSPQVLTELNKLIPITGNQPKTIKKVRDKPEFFKKLKELNVQHPETALTRSIKEGNQAAKDIGYPVLVKPLTSLGGSGIRKAKDKDELEKVFPQIPSSSSGVLIQEFLSGTNTSMSFLSSKEATLVLTLNEQLLGVQNVGQKEPFGYCGNIVPLSANNTLMEACNDIAQKVAAHFKLLGSNGIDMVISKDGIPYVVEINPRFQGTQECVEKVLGINLVNAHIKACIKGVIPSFRKRKATNYCVRLILYAYQRSMAPNLSDLEEVRDIPLTGVLVEESEPLCSIVTEGKTRSSAFKKARMLANHVYGLVKPMLQ
jgi:hypothetical protein